MVGRIKERISLNDVVLIFESANLGDGRASFGLGPRAWLIS